MYFPYFANSALTYIDDLSLRDVSCVVLDEADTLFAKGKDFEQDIDKIFKIFQVPSQLIECPINLFILYSRGD